MRLIPAPLPSLHTLSFEPNASPFSAFKRGGYEFDAPLAHSGPTSRNLALALAFYLPLRAPQTFNQRVVGSSPTALTKYTSKINDSRQR